ncbi:MAG: rhomboid family intramembrane serine protease [Gemmatimonadota bacterium]|nr:rhomboid family intramembrane serine protease [Gemmatimonadota bacterium]
MIPVGDELSTLRRPVMTWIILAMMFAVWILVQGAGANDFRLVASVCNLGMVPGEITHLARLGTAVPIAPGVACVVDRDPINILTPLLSMFLHGGWGHILGNALFFWVFGNNVEDIMGRGRFLAFYLICGLAAAAAQIAVEPASAIPTVGASGAISGVLGAYLLLFPRARIRMLFFVVVVPIRAWLVLIYWFIVQVVSGLPQLMQLRPEVAGGGGGVAVWAHVGGFLAGLALIRLFARPELVAEHRAAELARESSLRRRWI